MTRENDDFVLSGRSKFCKTRKEADDWIEEQQKESNLIEVAIESSEDYEDLTVSFVTAIDTDGNRSLFTVCYARVIMDWRHIFQK